jgi:hypothetical protein
VESGDADIDFLDGGLGIATGARIIVLSHLKPNAALPFYSNLAPNCAMARRVTVR